MPTSTKSDTQQYTKPEVREAIKKKVMSGAKGGKPGEWSARKAQLVASEYKQAGGGYKKSKTETQKSLQRWGDEKWTTSDGKKAQRAGGTTRYLPKQAWEKLDKEQKSAANTKKKRGSKQGEQFVANTAAASKARKAVAKKLSKVPASPGKKAAAKSASKKPASSTARASRPTKAAKKSPAKRARGE